MMRLDALVADLPGVRLVGDGSAVVSALTHDSREVSPGALYVALPGRQVDGRRFIGAALAAGAVAIALPEDSPAPEAGPGGTIPPVIYLAQPRPGLARLAARLAGDPSARLRLIGVTGTNGKTTIATLIADMIATAGQPAGLIGTNGLRIGAETRPARFTTPEAPAVQGLLAEMVTAGVQIAAMEVSSVGLAEDRTLGLRFAAVAFTNLSPDHLDYHGDMAAYGAAKARLFEEHPEVPAVINVEDPFGAALADRFPGAWRLALDGRPAEVHVADLVLDGRGFTGRLITPLGEVALRCPLLGRFNALNAATAAALALQVGIPPAAVAASLATAQVDGRMQPVGSGAPRVVVDYAHSPDALSRVIDTLRPLTAGRLWIVFGCGGDRDALKRGPMGAAAAAADGVIITSDNPRSEDPVQIAAAAQAGAVTAGRPASLWPRAGASCVILDRRAAIRAAIWGAEPTDTVLLAGKGHERTQEVAGVRRPFDDVAEAEAALAIRAGGPRFTTERLAALTEGALIAGSHRAFDGISIDSRSLTAGDLFFALRGPRFDGHGYVAAALAAGAVGAVVAADHPALADAETWGAGAIIAVADPEAALRALAADHRAASPGRIIALTGSSGKTTTKELLAAVLATVGPTHATPGNLNNHLGLPLTLLGLRPAHRFAVLELGMNHAGEIAALAALARPHVGVITTVGEAHIEHLGSLQAIARAKGELLDALPPEALAVTPSAVREVEALLAGLVAPRLTVGTDEADTVRILETRATAEGSAAILQLGTWRGALELRLSGAHNLSNAALALAVGEACGATIPAALAALAALAPPPLRGELRRLPDGGRVILDCYNANPQSMRAALESYLGSHPTGFAVLGDMLELGPAGPELHAALGAWLGQTAPGLQVVGVGPLAAELVAAARAAGLRRAWSEPDAATAVIRLRAERPAGAPLLLKGSRGVRLERVFTGLCEEGA